MSDKDIVLLVVGALIFFSRPIIGIVGIILEKRAERAEHRRWQEACKPKPAPRPKSPKVPARQGSLEDAHWGFTFVDPETIESREIMRKLEELQKGTPPGSKRL